MNDTTQSSKEPDSPSKIFDELASFLEDATPSKSLNINPPSTASTSSGSSTIKNTDTLSAADALEAELFELLNSPSTKALTANKDTDFSSTLNDEDVMSWLEESPIPSTLTSAKLPEDINAITKTIPNTDSSIIPTTITSSSSSSAPSSSSNIISDLNISKTNTNLDSSSSTSTKSSSEYLTSLSEIISSPFPDLDKLRELIHSNSYIPIEYNRETLILLLSGSIQYDEEANNYYTNLEDKNNHIKLYKKLKFILKKYLNQLFLINTNLTSLKNYENLFLYIILNEFFDIILLFLLRYNLNTSSYSSLIHILFIIYNDFSHYILKFSKENDLKSIEEQLIKQNYLDFLKDDENNALFTMENDVKNTISFTDRSLTSSCFYSVINNFFFFNLSFSSSSPILSLLGSWTRLILFYHAPNLGRHLDKEWKNWNKINYDLEEIEEKKDIDGEKSEEEEQGGINFSTLYHLFSCCAPYESSAQLLNWSVLNKERWSFIYFYISLLILHKNQLLSLKENELKNYLLSFNNYFFTSSNSENELYPLFNIKKEKIDYKLFISGWIHATSFLISTTSNGVREGINQIEAWLSASDGQSSESQSPQDNIEQDKNKPKTNFFTKIKLKLNEKSTTTTLSSPISNFPHSRLSGMSQVACWSNVDEVLETSCTQQRNKKSLPPSNCNLIFDSIIKSSSSLSTCFYLSNYDDYLPQYFIIDCRKKLHDQLGLFPKAFRLHLSSTVLSTQYSVRNPKASNFSIDNVHIISPSIEDSEALTNLLLILQPLYNSNHHIVILGEGEDYFKWRFQSQKSNFFINLLKLNKDKDKEKEKEKDKEINKENENPEEDVEENDEENKNLSEPLRVCSWNNLRKTYGSVEIDEKMIESYKLQEFIAKFLQVNNFRYVSILEGGFGAALKYLNRPEKSLSISSALVDVDKFYLNSFFNLSTDGLTPLAPLPPLQFASPNANQNTSSSTFNSSSGSDKLKNTAATAATATGAAIRTVGNLFSSWREKTSNLEISNAVQETFLPSEKKSGKNSPPTPVPPSTTSTQPNMINNPISHTTSEDTPSTGSSSSAPVPPPTTTSSKFLSGWNKSIGVFESIKKGISTAVSEVSNKASGNTENKQEKDLINNEEEHDFFSQFETTTTISVSKSESEKSQALAFHRMAGLKKGNTITISRDELPGCSIFPCTKWKEIFIDNEAESLKELKQLEQDGKKENEEESEPTKQEQDNNLLLDFGEESSLESNNKKNDDEKTTEESSSSNHYNLPPLPSPRIIKKKLLVNRYLVVSKERLIVLEPHGEGIGSLATVKSNHHLTEVNTL